MKVIYLVFVSLFLFACKPNTEPTLISSDIDITDTIVDGDDTSDVKQTPPMKVLWVNRSLAGLLARDLKCPILLFVYENKYQPSVDMDLLTFANPDLAYYINENFVSVRASYSDMDGNFAPSTVMIISQNGEIILTTIGYIEPQGMITILEQAKALNALMQDSKDSDPNVQKFKKKEASRISEGRTWKEL